MVSNLDIVFLPDTQCKPGAPLEHLSWAGEYVRKWRPKIIVHAGDHYDMPSLSSYDRGKKSSEGARVSEDIAAGNEGLDLLMRPWYKLKSYAPDLYFTAGNHEYRYNRHINDYPVLAGSLPDPLDYLATRGWNVSRFLQPVRISGILFCHLFPRTLRGTTTAGSQKTGASSAYNQVRANMSSCIAGHKQGLDTSIFNLEDRRLRGVIAGSYYQHDEDYMPCNNYWRGILHLRRVTEHGDFDLTEVSLGYLQEKYG